MFLGLNKFLMHINQLLFSYNSVPIALVFAYIRIFSSPTEHQQSSYSSFITFQMSLAIPEALGAHHLKGLDGSLYCILSPNRCHKLVSTFYPPAYF